MATSEWHCPYCDGHQVLTKANTHSSSVILEVGKTKYGTVGLIQSSIRCANKSCNELILNVKICEYIENALGGHNKRDQIGVWTLRPESFAKPQAEYIPGAILEDYYEACAIRDKSPKASATLARRCLQGMIRDFCKISKPRLIEEIRELRKRVDDESAPKGVEAETIDAIDAVRDLGNIGAHMERDISLIVEVDPGEAQILIELIELLFKEWYVARHVRQGRLDRMKSLAAEKKKDLDEKKAVAAEVRLSITDQSDTPEN